jgi:chromosomal replication initiator protein
MNANRDSYSATDAGDTLWSSVLDSLRSKLSAKRLDEVERCSQALERTSTSLRVSADPQALQRWAHDGRLSLLDAATSGLTDGAVCLAMLPVLADPDAGDPTQTLESFIAGPRNQEAFACARALARGQNSGRQPVVIEAPQGAGKTHLLRGIAAQLRRAGRDVHYTSAEQLSLAVVEALRGEGVPALRARMQAVGCLLVDDVQDLRGRETTQDELAHITETRASADAPVVLTSSLPLAQLHDLRPALRVQLEAGHSVELAAPEWETRVAIILDRIALWQVQTRPDVASFLAGAVGSDLARLDLVLTRLMTHPACAGGLSDPELVRRVLANRGPVVASTRPQEVIRLVSQHFSVRPTELRSAGRSPRVTIPRQVGMYLMRHHCGLSYPEIGQRFRRHHTTAMHACKRVETQREKNSNLRATVLLLEKELLRLSEDAG